MKPSDIAAEAAVWGLIETEAKKRKDEARAWLAEHMGPDLLAVAAVANGQTVGRASYVEGKSEWKISDESIFRDFVEEHYPDEIVVAVNPAFKKHWLSGLHDVGGVVVDSFGVDIEEAGVELHSGTAYVSVKKSQDARATVVELLSQGRLSLDGIQALPPAPEPLDRYTTDRIAAGLQDD